MWLKFQFFKDTGGRLRAHLYVSPDGERWARVATKPVERRRDGKRYNIGKVFGLWGLGVYRLSPQAWLALQTAQEGEEVVTKVVNGVLLLPG